jgi:hypothetical protein
VQVDKHVPPFVANLESQQSISLSKLRTLREHCRKSLAERNVLHGKMLAHQAKKSSANAQKLNSAIHDWKQAAMAYDLTEADYENALDDFENDKTYTLMTLLCNSMTAQMVLPGPPRPPARCSCGDC